jgi:hypothetical protein
VATLACTRGGHLVCIPNERIFKSGSDSQAGQRSGIRFRESPQLPIRHLRRRLVFVVVAFPPPPVYVPAKRGQSSKALAALLLGGRSFPPSATRFYPGASEVSADTSQPAFRLRRGALVTTTNRSAVAPGRLRHRIPPSFPSPVTAPVRTATGRAQYARTGRLSRGF